MSLPDLVRHYLSQKEELFAEVIPSEPIYKAWIRVSGINLQASKSLGLDKTKRFLLRWYEVHIPLYQAMQAQNWLMEESQASNFMRLYISNEEALLGVLGRWQFELDDLVPHWKINFPFE